MGALKKTKIPLRSLGPSADLNFISSHLLPDPHLIDKKCCYLVYSNSETKTAI